ncbi:MAG: hypothetical protein HYS57_00965 [Parcubacteria group bacterium]|nr:hypothetical protein [Parcubacteria group bacterium]
MSWNKGFTKETHPSVMKISQTMRRKRLDNFRAWRQKMKETGKIPAGYPEFPKTGDLAEFIGVILGDGHIQCHPRTQGLIISCNSEHHGFIKRYSSLTEQIFNKKPRVYQVPGKNNVRIRIYQNMISERLGVPCGNRGRIQILTPRWIKSKEQYLLRFLRGLFEAEGSLSIHLPTYTYNFAFSNRNPNLLEIVQSSLIKLGFHPEVRYDAVRLRRRQEVENFRKLIKFREY